MIAGAVLFPPSANPASDATVIAGGDENGVMVTITAKGERWDLYLPTCAARKLIFDLHRAVLTALEAEVQP